MLSDHTDDDDANDSLADSRENSSSELDFVESEALNLKGLNLAKQGNISDAVVCFEKAVHLNPNNAKAWHNYGTSLTKLGKLDETAINCFEKALEIDPNNAEAWNNKASVLHITGKTKEALVCYKRAVELAPGNSKAWQNMGLLLEKLGDKKAATQCYKMAAQTRK